MLSCNCIVPTFNPDACKTCPAYLADQNNEIQYTKEMIDGTRPVPDWVQKYLPGIDLGLPPSPGAAAPTPMQPDYFTKKQDLGKLRWDLLPLDAVEGIVKVLTFGAQKYSADSWKTVPDAIPRYTAALLRHLVALQRGEYLDSESGLPHIYHLATNALFLIHFYQVAHEDAF